MPLFYGIKAKSKIFSLLFWTLFSSINGEDKSLLNDAKRGEKLFYEANFEEAIPYYQATLQQIDDKALQTGIFLRLADCHLKLNAPNDALKYLKQIEKSEIKTFSRQHKDNNLNIYYISLMSRAFLETDDPFSAMQLYNQSHINTSSMSLEKGLHWMRCQDLSQAEKAFSEVIKSSDPLLCSDSHNDICYVFARYQLAKIAYAKNEWSKAQCLLEELNDIPSKPFASAITYLSGCLFLSMGQPENSLSYFKTLLPSSFNCHCSWLEDVLSHYILCHLQWALALYEKGNYESLNSLFEEAEPYLKYLLSVQRDENTVLLWGQFYLIKTKCCAHDVNKEELKEALTFSQENLKKESFQTLQLFQAAMSEWDQCREICEKMSDSSLSPHLQAKVHFTLGLKTLEEGWKTQDEVKIRSAIILFQNVLSSEDSTFTTISLKYLTFAWASLPGKEDAKEGWMTLEQLKRQNSYFPEADLVMAHLAMRIGKKENLEYAKRELLSRSNAHNLLLASRVSLQGENYEEADVLLSQIIDNPLYNSSHSEAFFWKAYSAGKRGKLDDRKKYLQCTFEGNANAIFAPMAYFLYYPYSEYMQGSKKAIKHLIHMPELYKEHPLCITAYYLTGLYYLKDHISPEGAIIRSKNILEAIEAFQNAETSFETLENAHALSLSELPYFIQTYLYAKYERAVCNFEVAQHSEGGKKAIYLDYAESLFKELIEEFIHHSERVKIYSSSLTTSHPLILAKAFTQLAELYIATQRVEDAESLLKESIVRYHDAHITQSHQLMHTWRSLAHIALIKEDHQTALEYFYQAENSLVYHTEHNASEQLDLKIEQSQCYKHLKNYDQAMKHLSAVINEDVLSPLRVKAMFLRAEIYELEGREELAIKQLEATSRKGGEWAKKAKEKLKENYGYSMDP